MVEQDANIEKGDKSIHMPLENHASQILSWKTVIFEKSYFSYLIHVHIYTVFWLASFHVGVCLYLFFTNIKPGRSVPLSL